MLQSSENWHSFSVLNKRAGRVCAIIYFNISDTIASSPLRSPFGSYELSAELHPLVVFEFFEFVYARLRAKNVSKIIIKEPPSLYDSHRAALVQVFLSNLDFQIRDAEAGAIVHIDGLPFIEKLNFSEKGRLRQAHDAGLYFKEINMDDLTDIYLFIYGCQKQRGYSLSMTLSALSGAVENFRDRYLGFGIFKDDKLIAASITVRVKRNILYNFYCSHLQEFNHLSPVIMLLEGIYNYGRNNQARILDLGTSAIDGKPNFGLLDFKLRLGAALTTKLTFEKNLI